MLRLGIALTTVNGFTAVTRAIPGPLCMRQLRVGTGIRDIWRIYRRLGALSSTPEQAVLIRCSRVGFESADFLDLDAASTDCGPYVGTVGSTDA